jgi:hypothetical protein
MSTSVPQVVKIVSMDVSRAYEELKKLFQVSSFLFRIYFSIIPL